MLQWGPETFVNSVAKTYGWWTDRRATYDTEFHTYALEWTDKFVRCYLDNRNTATLELSFKKENFWQRGKYPQTTMNGSTEVVLTNPWALSYSNAAPFDQGESPFPVLVSVYGPSNVDICRLLSRDGRRSGWHLRLVPGWRRRQAVAR